MCLSFMIEKRALLEDTESDPINGNSWMEANKSSVRHIPNPLLGLDFVPASAFSVGPSFAAKEGNLSLPPLKPRN